MNKSKPNTNRRDFFKICGLSSLPLFIPTIGQSQANHEVLKKTQIAEKPLINFISDGLFFSPEAYLEKLQEIHKTQEIQPDFYGNGGATRQLEETFAKATGKEKAIFMPSGTMANQLAIKILNGQNTKAIVPENSHIFRDEADAAQAVHGKRLIPVGKDKAYFGKEELQETITYYNEGEVFKSGLGTIAIESPVRRADGVAIPLETIKDLSKYCKEKGYKTHLDGARLHIASAFTGVSVAEYASYFDTVYISLYKYLNANGGAILCGDADVIDKMAHQIKIYGGTSYQTWGASAMALHYLNGIEERWGKVAISAKELVKELNKIQGVKITDIENGTNIYDLKLGKKIDLKKLATSLSEENVYLGRANEDGIIKMMFNESLLQMELVELIQVWKKAIYTARS